MEVRTPLHRRWPVERLGVPLPRVAAVAALLVTAGGLAIPVHRDLFGALASLVVLAVWFLPEPRDAGRTLAPALAADAPRRAPPRAP